MRLALYHPSDGYYATRVPGHGSDYRTSPSISPWFGRFVARQLESMWEALGAPDPFWVVEVGAGLGDLAAAAMESPGPLSDALHWRFVERFERVRSWQRRRLGSAAAVAAWSTALGEPPGVVGCVLANEVLDNFPVHVLEVTAGGVQELYVDLDGAHLVERLGPLSTPSLAAPARQAASQLGEGARFELCPELGVWSCQASRALQRGYLLLFDYGDVEPDIWLEHPRGTIVTHGPADTGPSPLDEPGRKDITAEVNFSAVLGAVEAAGFSPEPLVSQRTWLLSLGLAQVAEEIEVAGFQAALEGWLEQAEVLQGELGLLLELGAFGGLGDLLVVRAAKGAPALVAGRQGDEEGSGTLPQVPINALVAEEDDPVAEGPGLDEPEVDPGV
jgi:SAM-dependent MidA family methyltransferase